MHHSRNFQRRRGRAKKLCEIEQPLRPIPLHEWQRKNYPDVWHRYFQYQLLLEWNRHWQPYWVFAQPSLYRLKIGRNWIYHVQEIDPEIERRLGELDRWFELHQGWRRYGWLKGRRQSCRWHDVEHKKQRFLKNEHRREIEGAYLAFPEVEPAASVWRIPTSFRRSSAHFPGVAQCRGNELRLRPVQVQVLPPGRFPNRDVGTQSFSDLKLRQRSIRLLTGRAGRKSLRVHNFENKHRFRSTHPYFT